MKKHTFLKRLACTSTAMVVSGGTIAQPGNSPTQASAGTEDAAALEEIIVTARRRDEPVINVPSSVTSLSADAINDAGVENAQDLLSLVPGVHFQDSTAPIQGEITIRGSATSQGTNADATVGVYRDGVFILGGRFGGRRFSRIDLFDVQRVEVLRGAQASLYGRNAVGGAINIISNKPTFDGSSGFLTLGYGNNERYEARGVINVPLGEKFAFRAGVDHVDQSDGFFYNPLLDDYYDNEEFIGYKASLRFTSGALDATLSYDFSDNDGRTVALQITPEASPNNPLPVQQDRFEMEQNTPSFFKEEIENVALNVTYDLGFADLVSTTGYRERSTDTSLDIDFIAPSFNEEVVATGGVAVANPNLVSTSQIVTTRWFQNLHLTGEAVDNRLSWLVGGDWTRLEDDFARQFRVLNIPPAGFLEDQELVYDSWSVYGLLSYDFTDRLSITAEARHSDDEKDFVSARFNPLTGAPLASSFFVDAVNRDESLDTTLSLQYELASDWMAYVRYASAYRAGGFNENLGVPQQPIDVPPDYGKETYDTYELGTKAEPVRGVLLTAAGFYIDGNDVLATRDNGCRPQLPQCPERPTTFLQNAGTSEVMGVEFEANLRGQAFGGRNTLTLGATVQDGEYTSGPFDGIEVPRLPDFIYTMNLNHSRKLADNLNGFVNLQVYGQRGGKQDLDTDFDLQDFDLVNLRVGVRTSRWNFVVESKNIFDDVYSIQRNVSANRINRPRTWVGRLTVNF